MRKSNIGREGELLVCRYIELNGMKILRRNFKVQGGEADIIAECPPYICFVEIKLRKTDSVEIGRSVGTIKQRRVIKSAEKYLRETGCKLQPRFDVVFVNYEDGEVSLEYIENAYDGSGIL